MWNDMPSALKVHYGVPQESVLGPILFNIYVNDFSDEIKDCFLIQYADDTQYLQTGTADSLPQLIHNTEQTLTKIKHYFNKTGLLLNLWKHSASLYVQELSYPKFPVTQLSLLGRPLSDPASVKNLGVHFYNYMSFEVHVTEMNKKKLLAHLRT